MEEHISHYYGDTVRQFLVAAALVMIVATPVLGDLLPLNSAVQVGFALVLVLLAALTGPHARTIMWCNAFAAALGGFLLQVAAINLYSSDLALLFLGREFVAIVLFIAFYYSVKTLRAMHAGTIGTFTRVGEFDDTKD